MHFIDVAAFRYPRRGVLCVRKAPVENSLTVLRQGREGRTLRLGALGLFTGRPMVAHHVGGLTGALGGDGVRGIRRG